MKSEMRKLYHRVHNELPVFEIDNNAFKILYTPGYFVKIINTRGLDSSILFSHPECIEDDHIRRVYYELLGKAKIALGKWESFKNSPFRLECLTIHVGSECNMNCSYCYSKIDNTDNNRLKGFPDKSAIEKLMNYVTDQNKGKPGILTVVFHGSGEPTYHWSQLVECHNLIDSMAKSRKLNIFYYIATNGCLTETQVDWLSSNINLIGLSCDGPAEVHNRQRRAIENKYMPVSELCKRIRKEGGEFDLRVTVTKESMDRQYDIAKYLIDTCNPKNIRIEPEYLSPDNPFSITDANKFYIHYVKAKKYAQKLNVNFSYSGVRMEEIHGSYCDVLRNTIRISPDNNLRNCFCFMKDKPGYITGNIESKSDKINMSTDIADLKLKALKIPEECYDCINMLHCSRGCPDYCIIEGSKNGYQKLNSFRCRFHQLLTVNRIKSLASNVSISKIMTIS